MKKQARFIKHKASVGLSLFLLLVNQIATHAETCSDKTKWLTSNIDKTRQIKSSNSLVTLKVLSAKQDNYPKSNSIIVSCSDDLHHTIKLRPFMANRKLPSRHDLELALIEQKAKLADENNARLNGQISTFVAGDENNSYSPKPYVQTPSAPVRQNTAQSNNNHNYKQIARSTQGAFTLMKQAEQHLLSSSRSLISQPMQNPAISQSMISNINTMPAGPINISNTQILPNMSMNMPAEEAGPSAFSLPIIAPANPQVSSIGFGTAGPPPFPLNLLPEASLKQLVRNLAGNRSSRSTNAPQAGFGSWHNSPSPLSNGQGNRSANLPYAGFQSHLVSPNSHNGKRTNIRHIAALPAVTGSPIRGAYKQTTHNAASAKDTAARNRMLLESQVKVAAYPLYATQSLKPWSFAQQ